MWQCNLLMKPVNAEADRALPSSGLPTKLEPTAVHTQPHGLP